jgi:hypothetical protein
MSAAPGRQDQTMPPVLPEPSVQATPTPVEQPALIAQVERLHAVVAVVASLVAFALTSRPIWSAVVAGTLVGAANFHMLALVTTRLVSGSNTSRQVAIGVLLLKFTVLAGVLGAVVKWLQPDGITFVAALTLAPVCLVTVILRGRKEVTAPTGSPLEVR